MRMKVCILLLFVSSCLARTSPERGRKMPFQSPTEIKTIVLACDQDKDGELNSKELEECVSSMIYIIFFPLSWPNFSSPSAFLKSYNHPKGL